MSVLRSLLLLLFLGFGAIHAQAEEFLDPLAAFQPEARALDGNTVEVRFRIAKNYYLYREQFKFSIASGAQPAASPALDSSPAPGSSALVQRLAPPAETVVAPLSLGIPHYPKGKRKIDEVFGEVEIYDRDVRIALPVIRNPETAAADLPLTLAVTSRGCAEAGLCYPPQTQQLSLLLPAANTPPAAPYADSISGEDSGDESGRIARMLHGADFWLVLASFFGFGVLLALTPCVFPMIPILSSVIVGSSGSVGVSRGRALLLSLAYIQGMALTYALAGVAAGLSGVLLTQSLQNPWVLGVFASIFVVLALSMFGFFELQLPTALQSRMNEGARHIKGGSIFAVFVMGALSALIVGPCVAPPLFGALIYIGQTENAVKGGLALFCMGQGMGLPLLLVGLSAGTLLPRAGPWMEGVKKAFGVILLAVALWMIAPLLPVAAQMFFWAFLLIIPAVYLHALDPLPAHARGWHRFWKGIGIVMLLCGAALLVGALSGGKDPFQPLASLRMGAGASEGADKAPLFTRVHSLDELDTHLRAAKQPVLLDFYADWCVSCKEMEHFTFSDPQVREQLSRLLLLQVDVTANTPEDLALLKRFGLFGPPGIIFFDAGGKELPALRTIGFQNTDAFLATLARIPGVPNIAKPAKTKLGDLGESL
ncbi:MAG: protein-disulfide reductase DsbD [Betaproteobacteria bacterium]|nr:protein-disulfide reductase DsbD [Betaproteobacteria bacterium]